MHILKHTHTHTHTHTHSHKHTHAHTRQTHTHTHTHTHANTHTHTHTHVQTHRNDVSSTSCPPQPAVDNTPPLECLQGIHHFSKRIVLYKGSISTVERALHNATGVLISSPLPPIRALVLLQFGHEFNQRNNLYSSCKRGLRSGMELDHFARYVPAFWDGNDRIYSINHSSFVFLSTCDREAGHPETVPQGKNAGEWRVQPDACCS